MPRQKRVTENAPHFRPPTGIEFGVVNAQAASVQSAAYVMSMRMPAALYELGMINQIFDEVIIAKGDGIRGRPNRMVTATGERDLQSLHRFLEGL